MNVRCPMLVAVLCVVMDAGALAQAPALAPGQRVRVTAAAAQLHKQVATLQALEGDVLVLAVDTLKSSHHGVVERAVDTIIRVPVTAVERLDVYAGRQRNTWRGAGYGALAGAVLGGVLGAAECTVGSGSGSEFCKVGAVPGAVYGTMIGAAIFVLPGAGIGALSHRDRWEKVPADALRVTVVPMLDTRRAGLVLRVTF